MATRTLVIDGMNCGHCSAAVEKALGAVPGVKSVHVDLKAGKAVCEVEVGVEDASLARAVEDAGYAVRETI